MNDFSGVSQQEVKHRVHGTQAALRLSGPRSGRDARSADTAPKTEDLNFTTHDLFRERGTGLEFDADSDSATDIDARDARPADRQVFLPRDDTHHVAVQIEIDMLLGPLLRSRIAWFLSLYNIQTHGD